MNCINTQGLATHKIRENSLPKSSPDHIVAMNNYSQNHPSTAVYIRNLYKSFGRDAPVLQNLNMTVKKGTIYGLLGASGCGKTSVLNQIVGLSFCDEGTVLVFGRKPNEMSKRKMGYMPQDLALYEKLSIYEMVKFYGRLYNMTNAEVKERWVFLSRLLVLPTHFKLISDLSGGMRRRASLALALIHCPDLLILDEPTVGLDPLLRHDIWTHLFNIVTTLKTTIIITTHYIEEARFSDTIGVMRQGRILVENTPSLLLSTFNCRLLEEVVLQLCRQNEKGIRHLHNNGNYVSDCARKEVTFTSKWNENISVLQDEKLMDGIFRKAEEFDCELNQNSGFKDEEVSVDSIFLKLRNHPLYQRFQRIFGLTTVILLTFIRHPIFIVMILLLPTIQGNLTLLIIGTKPSGLKMGVINHELHNWSMVCDSPQHYSNSCDISALSCRFLNNIQENDLINLIAFDSEDDARRQVHLGRLWGYISFPEKFSQHTIDFIAAKQYAFNESIEGSRIHVHLDFSQYVGTFFMVQDLYLSFEEYLNQLSESCQIGGKEAEYPLRYRKAVYGHTHENYTEDLMPGVLLCCLMGILCIMTAIILIADFKQGNLSRASTAGLTTTDVMVSYMVTQGAVALAQVFIWTLVLHFGFGLTILGPAWLYFMICLLSGLCGAAMGILLALVFNDEVEAMFFGVFWIPILLLYGGVVWPLESTSKFWQTVGSLLPTTLPIISLRSVIVRGTSLTHPFVWPGVATLVAWTFFLSICVVIAYKKFAR